jgi:hypothetical protein
MNRCRPKLVLARGTARLARSPAHACCICRNDENFNQQQGAKAPSATKQMGQVQCYKTHESSNMAVAVQRTPFNNPRAQSAALYGKTRSNHVHARAMAQERVDRESGAEEIVAQESYSEKGSVQDILGNCRPYEPPSVGDAKDEVEEPQISHRDTEPSAGKGSMCDRKDDKDAEQEPEKSEMRLCRDLCRQSQAKIFQGISFCVIIWTLQVISFCAIIWLFQVISSCAITCIFYFRDGLELLNIPVFDMGWSYQAI